MPVAVVIDIFKKIDTMAGNSKGKMKAEESFLV